MTWKESRMPLALALVLFASVPDAASWRTYTPEGTDITLEMPGVVQSERASGKAADGAKLICRYRSAVGNLTYTVVIADVGEKLRPVYQKLWKGERQGSSVHLMLDAMIDGARDETKGELKVRDFGKRHEFPSEVAVIECPDGTGSAIEGIFTRRGLVYVSVRGPRRASTEDAAERLAGSIDFSARK